MSEAQSPGFWELVCTLNVYLYFLLVIIVSLALLTAFSAVIGPADAASALILRANAVMIVTILAAIVYLIRTCRKKFG